MCMIFFKIFNVLLDLKSTTLFKRRVQIAHSFTHWSSDASLHLLGTIAQTLDYRDRNSFYINHQANENLRSTPTFDWSLQRKVPTRNYPNLSDMRTRYHVVSRSKVFSLDYPFPLHLEYSQLSLQNAFRVDFSPVYPNVLLNYIFIIAFMNTIYLYTYLQSSILILDVGNYWLTHVHVPNP